MLGSLVVLLMPLAVHSMTFDQYLRRHGKSYTGAEYEARQALFMRRSQEVDALNARPNAFWVAGLNHLSDLDDGELRRFRGYNKAFSAGGSGDGTGFGSTLRAAARVQPSESKDWRDHRPAVVSPVKTQGACGSCWAFSAIQTIETQVALATGKLLSLSPQQLTSCTNNTRQCGGGGGCEGAVPELAFNYTVQAGGLSEIWEYPYLSGTSGQDEDCYQPASFKRAMITGYVQVPSNDAAALIEAVFSIGPVGVSVDASTWSSYQSGIFDHCNRINPDINHAVNVVGYGASNGTKYWLIRNSWGTMWGEDGYMRLLRHYDGTAVSDEEPCGDDITPSHGFACEGETEPITVCGECGILSFSSYPVGASYGYMQFDDFLV